MANSNAPTGLKLYPIPGTGVEVRATFHQANGVNGTYARFQISTNFVFETIDYDSGQLAITPIADGAEGVMVFVFIPTIAGIYYYRLCFWDNTNYIAAICVWSGTNTLSIGFPSIISVTPSNVKDKYTITAIIRDVYIKPPIVTLTIGNNTEVMDHISRTSSSYIYSTYLHSLLNEILYGQVMYGSGIGLKSLSGIGFYTYVFSKTVSLERGDYEYHVEVGNVWALVIDGIRFLHTNYNLNQEPKIEIFSGNRKINTWGHLLTENILPDFPEIEFDTDENIQVFDLTAKFIKNDFKIYNMEIQGKVKTLEGYHIRAKESAKKDLEQVVSFSSQAINSLSLLKSLLPGYIFSGALSEIIYLQTFVNESLIGILKRILILNYAIGYVRNKKIYLYDLGNTNVLFKLNSLDAQIGYSSDLSVIINKVNEYYAKKMYPVPGTIFTNYDATNWSGTKSNVRQTANGILPPSGNLYCLKGNTTNSRALNFLWNDFDQLSMNWSPDAATSLEIRLETDADNYRTHTRTFSGLKGAGFVLTGTLPADMVTKTLTFANKYIHIVQGIVTQTCSVKIDLKLSGAIVATSGWQTSTGPFIQFFDNILCDTIVLSFTNLYPVGTGYGVVCSNMIIEEYKQTYITTGMIDVTTWQQRYTNMNEIVSITGLGFERGESASFIKKIILGAVPPIDTSKDERYVFEKKGDLRYTIAYRVGHIYPGDLIDYGFISIEMNPYVENGLLAMDIYGSLTNTDYIYIVIGAVSYILTVRKITPTLQGEYVWIYANYPWEENYNLWDSLAISFSQFTIVGTPTNQVNTIQLIATGDNYYDMVYFVRNNPIPQYVEAENAESMKSGVKFQERKLDGWSSKESALAFAKAFVNLFGKPTESYSKQMSMQTDINIGDMVDCDGTIYAVYKIVYDLKAGQMTIFVGRSVTDTLEFFKETSRKIEAIEKVIY